MVLGRLVGEDGRWGWLMSRWLTMEPRERMVGVDDLLEWLVFNWWTVLPLSLTYSDLVGVMVSDESWPSG